MGLSALIDWKELERLAEPVLKALRMRRQPTILWSSMVPTPGPNSFLGIQINRVRAPEEPGSVLWFCYLVLNAQAQAEVHYPFLEGKERPRKRTLTANGLANSLKVWLEMNEDEIRQILAGLESPTGLFGFVGQRCGAFEPLQLPRL